MNTSCSSGSRLGVLDLSPENWRLSNPSRIRSAIQPVAIKKLEPHLPHPSKEGTPQVSSPRPVSGLYSGHTEMGGAFRESRLTKRRRTQDQQEHWELEDRSELHYFTCLPLDLDRAKDQENGSYRKEKDINSPDVYFFWFMLFRPCLHTVFNKRFPALHF